MPDIKSNLNLLRIGRRYFVGLLSGGLFVSINTLQADHHVISAEPFEVEFDLASASSRYTSVDDFYIRDHFPAPATIPSFVEIGGAVERPMKLGASELGELKYVEVGAVLECAGDPVSTGALVSNGLWGGWPLADVLARAEPAGASTHILLYGSDGYFRAIPITRLSEGAMLVCNLNGGPLRRSHGGPWRALFPGRYGMDSVKWIEKIVVATKAPRDSSYSYHLIKRGASGVRTEPLPRIQVKSIITSPRSGASLPAGTIEVSGLAWSGNGGIESVELSANGGAEWQAVPFEKRPQHEWVSWKKNVDARGHGAMELVARARDAGGFFQPQDPDPTRVDRYANNWLHRVRIAVV